MKEVADDDLWLFACGSTVQRLSRFNEFPTRHCVVNTFMPKQASFLSDASNTMKKHGRRGTILFCSALVRLRCGPRSILHKRDAPEIHHGLEDVSYQKSEKS